MSPFVMLSGFSLNLLYFYTSSSSPIASFSCSSCHFPSISPSIIVRRDQVSLIGGQPLFLSASNYFYLLATTRPICSIQGCPRPRIQLCILQITHFHKIYKFSPIFAKFIHFPLIYLFLLKLRSFLLSLILTGKRWNASKDKNCQHLKTASK